MHAAVGDAPFADAAAALLREAGVDLTGIATRAQAHTGRALILVDHKGENSIALLPEANEKVPTTDAAALSRA